MLMVVVGSPGASLTQASSQYCDPLHNLPVASCVGPFQNCTRPVVSKLQAPECWSAWVGVTTAGAPPPRDPQPCAVPSSKSLNIPEVSGGFVQPPLTAETVNVSI